MLKFKEGMDQLFFSDENINSLWESYYNLPSFIKIPFSKEISKRSYSTFQDKYNNLKSNAVLSDYFISIDIDSKYTGTYFPHNISLKETSVEIPTFWIISINKTAIYVNDIDTFFDRKDSTDFYNMDLALLNNPRLATDKTNINNSLSVELTGKSYDDVQESRIEIIRAEQELKEKMDSVRNARTGELYELNKRMETLKNEMEEKKSLLMAELRVKEEALELQKKSLEKEMFKLDSQIYDLKSYFGETYTLIEIRKGKTAPSEEPLIISQKIRYLNEDLAVLVGLYSDTVNRSNFIEALKYSDHLVNYFCQSDKSLTFIRLARNENITESFSYERKESENRYGDPSFYISQLVSERGYDMSGFIIKNGETLTLGILDEGHRTAVKEDVFADINRPLVDVQNMNEREYKSQRQKEAQEMLKRKFIFSIIQGLIDIKKCFSFTKDISIFSLPPEIIFSSASGRLTTNIYGSFRNLKEKLNSFTKVDDDIYVIDGCNDPDRARLYFSNWTPSFNLTLGLNTIKEIEIAENETNLFVNISREKVSSYSNTNSRYKIYASEFINLTYVNSVWINYFISKKECDGSTTMNSDFYLFAKHLMGMKDYVAKREIEERAFILKYYPQLDSVENWQVKLSAWKIQQKMQVRKITDFQAKRFVNALIASKINDIEWIYSDEPLNTLVEPIKIVKPMNIFNSEIKQFIKEKCASDTSYLFLKDTGSWINNFIQEKQNELDELNRNNKWSSTYHLNNRDVLLNHPSIATSIYERQIEAIYGVINALSKLENKYGVSSKGTDNVLFDLLSEQFEESQFSNINESKTKKILLLSRSLDISLYSCLEFEFARFLYTQTTESHTKEISTSKMKYPNELFVILKHPKGDGYVQVINGFFKKLLPLYYANIFLSMLSIRYFRTLDTINTVPYYRQF